MYAWNFGINNEDGVVEKKNEICTRTTNGHTHITQRTHM